MDLNREQCQTMGVNPNDVFTTLQIYLGSLYVNDFNRFGRTWQVVVQAERRVPRRPRQDQAAQGAQRRRRHGAARAPCSTSSEIGGPINIGRYNMYPAAAILGATKPGVSLRPGHRGDGAAVPTRCCRRAWRFEWTEINYMQIDAAKNIWNNLIFPLAVVFVFLVLAAQYESWALPLAVILVVPMCILGSLTGVCVDARRHQHLHADRLRGAGRPGEQERHPDRRVRQAQARGRGLSRREATLAACQLRLRPILMTSFAFILGVVPLLIATGAGAEMRRALGTAVFSGMLGVTLFGIFLTPVFFYVIEGFVGDAAVLLGADAAWSAGCCCTSSASLTLGVPWLLVLVRAPDAASAGVGPTCRSRRRRSTAHGSTAPRPRSATWTTIGARHGSDAAGNGISRRNGRRRRAAHAADGDP